MMLILHRLDGNVVCLRQDLITDFEQYRNHTSINCNGYNYLVKESIEEVLLSMNQLLESPKQISRVERLPQKFVFEELEEKKKGRKKKKEV